MESPPRVVAILNRVGGMRRRCDRCKTPLGGRRGHGFPSRDGRTIECGGCFTRVRIHTP